MRQFYEIYSSKEIVTPLVTQLPWIRHLIILGKSKRAEERELERQFKAALFEQVVLSPTIVLSVVRQIHPTAKLHEF